MTATAHSSNYKVRVSSVSDAVTHKRAEYDRDNSERYSKYDRQSHKELFLAEARAALRIERFGPLAGDGAAEAFFFRALHQDQYNESYAYQHEDDSKYKF